MAVVPNKKWTREEYLEYERSNEGRHEFLDGEIFAMVGASLKHTFIAASTTQSLLQQVNPQGCFVGQSDVRVKVSETGLYTYPDIVVICGTPQVEDDIQDTLLNPTLIIEVLSPSTERYDRGRKFQHYMTIVSLQEYVLIAQDAPRIERYQRQPDNQWLYSTATGLNATIDLPSIGCHLRLADVYQQVSFDQPV